MEAFKLLEAIGSTTSRNDKERFIKQGENNDVFRSILYYTYNNFLVYGIREDPKVKPMGKSNDPNRWGQFVQLLLMFDSRHSTGNDAIERLSNFLSDCTEEEYLWFMRVIKRDLKIGITAKTINKVIKGLVPVFECALANTMKKKFPSLYYIDRKYDGYRCLAFHNEDGSVQLRSRNGKELSGYDGIEEEIKKLPVGFVYDGEIMGRQGTFNEMQKSAFKKANGKDGVFHIFDMVHIDDFNSNNFTVSFKLRMIGKDNLQNVTDTCNNLQIVKQIGPFTNSEADIQKVYEYHTQFVSEGYEGTMVKDANAVYKMGKSNNILKIKDMETEDLQIVGVYEGEEGKQFEGTLGGVYVEWKGNKVGVGSGFSHELRDRIWANPSEYINKTIEVWFQEESEDKTGKKSLRFPAFKGFRPDKD